MINSIKSAIIFALVIPVSTLADNRRLSAFLSGAQEVPSISTGATGSFSARFQGDSIKFRLRYSGLEGDALQAHIHFAQRGVNGGVAVFLCTNLGNDPTGLNRPCPVNDGEIEGVITAADVIGPDGQGIAAGELKELLNAMKKRRTYINLHSSKFPGGELRGQIG